MKYREWGEEYNLIYIVLASTISVYSGQGARWENSAAILTCCIL